MSDQPSNPAPQDSPVAPAGTQEVIVRGTPVGTGEMQHEVQTQAGTVVTVHTDGQGAAKVVDTRDNNSPANTIPAASPEYGYRPEPIPGPGVAEIQLSSVEGYDPPQSAQDQIMARAHTQADAIVKAAEDTVKAMDNAEKLAASGEKTLAMQLPRGAGAEHTTAIGDEPATVTALDNVVRENVAEAKAEAQAETGDATDGGGVEGTHDALLGTEPDNNA